PGDQPTRPPTDENCTTLPPPWPRSCGITALETLYTPQKFVSNCSRKSSSLSVSIGARFAYPALLTTTSSRPNCSTPAPTAFWTASASVTSSARGSTRSAYF